MVPPPVAPEHEELSEQLNAYLDGELDAHARASVEAHLRTCLACQAELEQLRITRSALQALAPLRAPRPFTVTAPEPLDATGDGWLARLLPWTWRAGAFAAAGCLLVGMATVALPGPGAPGGAMLASQAVEKAAPAADSANTSQRAAAPAAPAAGAANAPIPQSAATPPGAAAAARSQQDTRDTFSGNSAPGAPPAAANAPSAARAGGAVAPPAATVVVTARQTRDSAAAPRPVAPIWFGAAGLLGLISAAGFVLDRRAR